MPSAEAALKTLLTTGSPNPVAAIIGTRVYPDVLPQKSFTLPAIRYQRISTPRAQYRDMTTGKAGYAAPRFQVDCYATSRLEAITLGQAVYGLLEGYSGLANGLRIDQISTEDEAGELEPGAGLDGADLYKQRLDLILYHPE